MVPARTGTLIGPDYTPCIKFPFMYTKINKNVKVGVPHEEFGRNGRAMIRGILRLLLQSPAR
jgi:hypothetical protein